MSSILRLIAVLLCTIYFVHCVNNTQKYWEEEFHNMKQHTPWDINKGEAINACKSYHKAANLTDKAMPYTSNQIRVRVGYKELDFPREGPVSGLVCTTIAAKDYFILEGPHKNCFFGSSWDEGLDAYCIHNYVCDE